MLRYLSPEWIDAADAAVATAAVDPSITAVIEQTVTGGPDGDRVHHLRVGGGRVRFASGGAPDADVRFTQPWTVAVDIARGRLSAQAAFIAGDLRIGGDVRVLIAAGEVLGPVDDLLAALRDRTDFGDTDPGGLADGGEAI